MTTELTGASEEATYCAVHPQTETTLRCNQCERYMCARCAVLTPTGYRCKECVAGRQKIFETALTRDYILAVPITTILGLVSSWGVTWIGFFALLLAPLAGSVAAEVVRFATGKRRSKSLFLAAAGGFAAGCIPMALFLLWVGALPTLVWVGIYGALATSTLYYRLSGISLRF